jgi:putative flippase GtrA
MTEPLSTPTPLATQIKGLRENKETQRFAKFMIVGGIGAVIDFSTFSGLNALGWLRPITLTLPFGLPLTGLGIAGAIAFTLAVASNFVWNRYWTYPDSRSKSLFAQLGSFFLVNVMGILIRIPILEYLSKPFGDLERAILPGTSAKTSSWLGETAAWALAVIIVMFWNFFVNRYWTYNDVK